MFEHYQYFLTLAEEGSVTRAAEKLFITHQALSRYLGKLEKECGVFLFHRKPVFSLTPEGQQLYQTLRQVELLEKNTMGHFEAQQQQNGGELNFGTTEGRFRILIPDLIERYETSYPQVNLHVSSANSKQLQQMLLDNKLDIALCGNLKDPSPSLESRVILQEKLYVVISQGLMQRYFGDQWETYHEKFKKGADLRLLKTMPFSQNEPFTNSAQMLERHCHRLHNLQLNFIHVSSQPDLHHILTTRNYAASFCLTMYLTNLKKISEASNNPLYVYPILGLTETNPVTLVYVKGRQFPRYGQAFLRQLQEQVAEFKRFDLM